MINEEDNFWRVRNDIELEKIHGEYALIAQWSAREVCPSIMIINETGAFFWKMITAGVKFDSIYEEMQKRYHLANVPKESVLSDFRLFLKQLYRLHYLDNIGEKTDQE